MAGWRWEYRPKETGALSLFWWKVDEIRCGCGLLLYPCDLSAFKTISVSRLLLLRSIRTRATFNEVNSKMCRNKS